MRTAILHDLGTIQQALHTPAEQPPPAHDPYALALETPNDLARRRTLARQTNAALSNASGDVTEAKTESSAGMQACNFGLWQNGAAHYRKALTLLGK